MTDNEIIATLSKLYKRIANITEPQILNLKAVKRLGELCKSTLYLINRQKAEKHRLDIERQAMRGAANSYKAENEKLKKLLEEAETNKKEAAKRFYKAGIKDFANTFTEQLVLLLALNYEQADIARKCASSLAEEMVGETK